MTSIPNETRSSEPRPSDVVDLTAGKRTTDNSEPEAFSTHLQPATTEAQPAPSADQYATGDSTVDSLSTSDAAPANEHDSESNAAGGDASTTTDLVSAAPSELTGVEPFEALVSPLPLAIEDADAELADSASNTTSGDVSAVAYLGSTLEATDATPTEGHAGPVAGKVADDLSPTGQAVRREEPAIQPQTRSDVVITNSAPPAEELTQIPLADDPEPELGPAPAEEKQQTPDRSRRSQLDVRQPQLAERILATPAEVQTHDPTTAQATAILTELPATAETASRNDKQLDSLTRTTAEPAPESMVMVERRSLGRSLITGGSLESEATAGPRVEPGQLMQRVAQAFSVAQNRGGGPIRLRLSPPELGSLRLEVQVEGGSLSAQIEAESAQARSLLVENLPILKERLAELGIELEKFDVQWEPPSDNQPQHEQHTDSRTDRPFRHHADEDGQLMEKQEIQSERNLHDGQLNVQV